MLLNIKCIDVGTNYCPCYLAEIGNCLVCSHLNGKGCGDCNWQGICIMNDFYWNGKRSAEGRTIIRPEEVSKKLIADNLLLLSAQIPSHKVKDFVHPGTFVFIKNDSFPDFYDVPTSVMDVDEKKHILHFAIQIVGPKTKALLKEEKKITIRGPYWNGIYGIEHIKTLENGYVLIITRGICQASALLLIKKLINNDNKVKVYIDPGSLGRIFIGDSLKELGITAIKTDITKKEKLNEIKSDIENQPFDLIYSGGGDLQHLIIFKIIKETKKEVPLIASNNNQIYCGEGICGSCAVENSKETHRERIYLCKAQFDYTTYVQRGFYNG